MKPRFILIAILAMFLVPGRMQAEGSTNSAAAAAPALPAQPTNAVVGLDFPSFQVISQHNIFDPNRRPRNTTRPPANITRPAQVDYFSLRGTMMYTDKGVAFFDGSSSQYSKAVTPADTIAGYKIAEIAFDHVKLAASSNQTVNLPVGSQMRRQDNGPWSLVKSAEPASESSAAATSDKPEEATPASGGAVDDVIKRLMQKREQEK